MANATTTVAGDVQLAGDLGGTGTSATSPQLSNSGVTAGTYNIATITVNAKGLITSASDGLGSIPTATTSVKGIAQIGTNISVSAGVISVPDASASVKGVVQIGSGLSVSSGTVSVADATTSSKGVVQIGSGLSVSSGVVSTSLTDATTSTKGVVQVGTGLAVAAGILSLNSSANATTGAKGVVQVGTNISVSSGTISVADATTSTKGVVQVGTGLAVSSGTVSVGANVPLLNTTNAYTKAQRFTIVSLVSGTTVALDGSLSNNYTLTLGTNATLSNPTNLGVGFYRIIVKQDSTGGRTLGFGSAYKFSGSSTISSTANSVNLIDCISDGTNLYCKVNTNYA